MTISTSIESDNGKWELSANYDEIRKRYYSVALKVPKKVVGNDDRFWDNSTYLYEELFPLVVKMQNGLSPVPVTELNTDVYNYLTSRKKDIEQLYEIFMFSKGLGWHNIR